MIFNKALRLFRKYSKCHACGSDTIGNGEGEVIVENEAFTRKCKCGWEITVDENDKLIGGES